MLADQLKPAVRRKPERRRGIARGPVRVILCGGILGLAIIAGTTGFTPSTGTGAIPPEGRFPGQSCWACPQGALPQGRIAAHAARGAAIGSCTNCHAGAAEASRPVRFVPTRPLPESFPLDAADAMTCTTCHDTRSPEPGFLRPAADGGHICLACHEESFFAEVPEPVRVLVFLGHLDTSGRSAAGIDAYSLRCMVCHSD